MKNIIKNGVTIIEHKNWNSKKFYTITNHHAATYRRCPKNIPISSKYHNDLNQHLCGGWSYFEDTDKEILKRIMAGEKPCGTMITYGKKIDKIKKTLQSKSDLWFKITKRDIKTSDGDDVFNIKVCQDKKSLIDLIGRKKIEILDDYYLTLASSHDIFLESIFEYAQEPMSNYSNIWTSDKLDAHIVGLFLGYPIDVTTGIINSWFI